MSDVEVQEQALDGATILAFHPLARREDGTEVVIGRSDSDVFVALPAIGAAAIELLEAGLPIGEVEQRIEETTGERIDVLDLAASLVECGLVARIDGRAAASPPSIRPMLPWLRTEHVRWLLSRPVSLALDVALAATILAAITVAVHTRAPLLDYRSLLWSEHGSAVILTQAAIAWSLILIHETAHLVTARAAGAPGRMEFGTRLQFLVAQTNVTGIWAAPKRHRLAVYSAGMKSDALIAAVAVLVSAATEPGGLGYRVALVTAIVGMTALGLQLLIFMRTDVYFIVQDLTRSRNLYGDSTAFARYLAALAAARFRHEADRPAHPLAALEPRERGTVQRYAALLVAGTAVCLAFAAVVYLPYNIGLIGEALASVFSGSPAAVADGLVVSTVLGAVFTIWARAWWARHGERLRERVSRARDRRRGGPVPPTS